MNCRTCKHSYDSKLGLGKCKGIFGSTFVIPISETKGKLVSARKGIIAQTSYVMTPEDWYCKNWTHK